MIHSIVSPYDIFYNDSPVKTEFCRIDGGFVETSTFNGQKRIRRLYSTDPYMYLNKRYYPYSAFSGNCK